MLKHPDKTYDDDICEDQEEVVSPRTLARYIESHGVVVLHFDESFITVETDDIECNDVKSQSIPSNRKAVRDFLGY